MNYNHVRRLFSYSTPRCCQTQYRRRRHNSVILSVVFWSLTFLSSELLTVDRNFGSSQTYYTVVKKLADRKLLLEVLTLLEAGSMFVWYDVQVDLRQ